MTTQRKTTDRDVVKIIQQADKPFGTATEIGDELEISRQAAHQRLSKRCQDGDLTRQKVGANAVVWWPAD